AAMPAIAQVRGEGAAPIAHDSRRTKSQPPLPPDNRVSRPRPSYLRAGPPIGAVEQGHMGRLWTRYTTGRRTPQSAPRRWPSAEQIPPNTGCAPSAGYGAEHRQTRAPAVGWFARHEGKWRSWFQRNASVAARLAGQSRATRTRPETGHEAPSPYLPRRGRGR